ncbi:hypothetical protein AA105894_1622 [Asaia spathodeae NBRC 105894]|nr:hypothetical protein AA105894_1622 [Asaia spathodeae NBRC 105894]
MVVQDKGTVSLFIDRLNELESARRNFLMKPNSGENLKRAPRAIDICRNLVTGADRIALRPFETVIRGHEIGVPG